VLLRPALVGCYILACLRTGAAPWRYFQLNAPWFDEQKELFSKLALDREIPAPWRLPQRPLAEVDQWHHWPAFLKPEWGQNGRGIRVASDPDTFARLKAELLDSPVPYLVQGGAPGRREFELFYVRDAKDPTRPALLSLTETTTLGDLPWPVHSILDPHTRYHDLSHELDAHRRQRLWELLEQLSPFRLARVGMRADDLEALLAGDFKIIEINLFVPLPLALLDEKLSRRRKWRLIIDLAGALARLTKALPPQPAKAIFWPMVRLNTKIDRTRPCES